MKNCSLYYSEVMQVPELLDDEIWRMSPVLQFWDHNKSDYLQSPFIFDQYLINYESQSDSQA